MAIAFLGLAIMALLVIGIVVWVMRSGFLERSNFPNPFRELARQEGWTYQANYADRRDVLLGQRGEIKWILWISTHGMIWETEAVRSPHSPIFIGPKSQIKQMAQIKSKELIPTKIYPLGSPKFQESFAVLAHDLNLARALLTPELEQQFLNWPVGEDHLLLVIGVDNTAVTLFKRSLHSTGSLDWVKRVVELGILAAESFRKISFQ